MGLLRYLSFLAPIHAVDLFPVSGLQSLKSSNLTNPSYIEYSRILFILMALQYRSRFYHACCDLPRLKLCKDRSNSPTGANISIPFACWYVRLKRSSPESRRKAFGNINIRLQIVREHQREVPVRESEVMSGIQGPKSIQICRSKKTKSKKMGKRLIFGYNTKQEDGNRKAQLRTWAIPATEVPRHQPAINLISVDSNQPTCRLPQLPA